MASATVAVDAPMETICENAGVKISAGDKEIIDSKNVEDRVHGIDVTRGVLVNLKNAGILDSYLSIDEALKNAGSIACAYLRTNTLIMKETTQNK